ncbi:DUF4149 domain-containing protein [Granulicella tundricola]|uniref:TMEM205-like domain-containing protein n=1 Tax=Granulicella tundricola (strain ATCC BAA-1859 / DSM 23138 / MP5ACTX9) TaxID=1198114 RepID=E8X734_GRATM|nr:DUF4149 domain-containing protein [Granulicella tundricola]ADW71268.1 hypothetical protein AciX9_4309 [Granulicella tundricola MP5ACTX9]
MQIHIFVGALSFCIFSLGLFLGAGVRPLLMPAMKSDPALIGPIVTGMFSRYNVLALALSGVSLILELMSSSSRTERFILIGLTLLLALKVAFDSVIKRREGAAQIRGRGEEGMQLDLLHQIVEKATLVIIVLSLGSFILSLLQVGEP